MALVPTGVVLTRALFEERVDHGVPMRTGYLHYDVRLWLYERNVRPFLRETVVRVSEDDDDYHLYTVTSRLWFDDPHIAFEFKMRFC